MKELKENLKQTICKSCEWVQKELAKKQMSPEVVEALPETLKAISILTNTLKDYRNY